LNAGEPGFSDAETVIVIVPVESGSGKFGTPWERMQAVNLTPAAPVPRLVEMLAPIPAPPGGIVNGPELLLALLPAVFEVVVPRFAIEGDFEPPPQPAVTRANRPSSARSARTKRDRMPQV
jgi:hypothetical protein